MTLDGAWTADDGATYFIRQLDGGTVVCAGLHESGFHRGVEFTNVFWGTVSDDGMSVCGEWADVPRGGTVGFGSLCLNAALDGSGQLFQNPEGSTGGFGAQTWTPGGQQLAPQDIMDLAHRVLRYDGPLYNKVLPARDFTVVLGGGFEVEFPTNWPKDPKSYCSFRDDWDGDADINLRLDPQYRLSDNVDTMEPDFWTTGWVDWGLSPTGPELIGSLFDQFPQFQCEAGMYGRENECNEPTSILLPGWFEQSGDSVLVNGRPINGNVVGGLYLQPLVFNPTTEHEVTLSNDDYVRVTGVVAPDNAHGDSPPEIHPIYSIDVFQDFSKRPHRCHPLMPWLQAPGPNLTGAWHCDDFGTYYLRQSGTTVWWLGLSRDQGRTFANVFHGTLGGGRLGGSWADVPVGQTGTSNDGTLTIDCPDELATTLTVINSTGGFGGTRWTKLYDTDPGEQALRRTPQPNVRGGLTSL